MVDYVKNTGSTGQMMIRDTGGNVEFWLYAGSATFDNQMYWNYSTPHGSSGRLVMSFQGGAWRYLGVASVTVSGNVSFHIEATGTSGLGGPTTHTVYLNRASRPSPPGAPKFANLDNDSVDVWFDDGPDNGAAIDLREIWWSTDPNNAAWLGHQIAGPSNKTFTGLAAGTTYYFWGKTHNSQGWSDLGPRSQITTHRVPDAPSPVSFSLVTQNSIRTQFTGGYDGGSPIIEYQLGYGQTTTLPDTIIQDNDWVSNLTNLDPGKRYYFWSRARNYVGWGPWSARTDIVLIAGAYVKVGTVHKRAVPYVRQSGVWKLVKPYVKSGGVWRETES